jgi:glycosyltransferase involved in cell wall biosynthesis
VYCHRRSLLGEKAPARPTRLNIQFAGRLPRFDPGARPVCIYKGLETECRREEPTIGARILDWGIEPGNYILFLGRFSPEKNCHLLIEAYEKLRTNVQLVLAGGSNCNDAYSRQVKNHASDRIRVLDYVSGDTFEELLTNAMLFVLPSELEGLSLALLEAMGAGLCVLTSDIPENLELMQGAGFTFRRGDASDLQRMLRLLIVADSLREAAGRAARKRIQTEYLWNKIAEEIEQTYLKMVGWETNKTSSRSNPEQVPAQPVPLSGRIA